MTVTGDTRAFAGPHFCPACGSSVFSRSDAKVEVHLGTLDGPGRSVPDFEL